MIDTNIGRDDFLFDFFSVKFLNFFDAQITFHFKFNSVRFITARKMGCRPAKPFAKNVNDFLFEK